MVNYSKLPRGKIGEYFYKEKGNLEGHSKKVHSFSLAGLFQKEEVSSSLLHTAIITGCERAPLVSQFHLIEFSLNCILLAFLFDQDLSEVWLIKSQVLFHQLLSLNFRKDLLSSVLHQRKSIVLEPS